MLASDILPPRTVSSRGMMGMLNRLETAPLSNYIFKLIPSIGPRNAERQSPKILESFKSRFRRLVLASQIGFEITYRISFVVHQNQ